MTARLVPGRVVWGPLTVDEEGYREYKLEWYVLTDDAADGPFTVWRTPGLPTIGAPWRIGNDFDVWVWCRPTATVTALNPPGSPTRLWKVQQTFSNKEPPKGKNRCLETKIEDPLLEPPKLSGGFKNKPEEATVDRFGVAILNSAFEQIRGPQVEFDMAHPSVKIQFNVPWLDPRIFSMINTVNAYPLWGLPPRTIKLSNIPWEQKYYGICNAYYTITFEFEICTGNKVGTGQRTIDWDRNILDEGTKVLNGRWDKLSGKYILININGAPPNPKDPSHFIKAVDSKGSPTKILLDGAGVPVQGGPQLVTGSSVAEILITNPGTGYLATYPPIVTVTGGGGQGCQAVATVVAGQIVAITVVDPGGGYGGIGQVPGAAPSVLIEGYKVNDVLTVQGGTPTLGDNGQPLQATLSVAAVNPGGVIQSVTVANKGSYTVVPTNPVQVTGGNGSGATFSLTTTNPTIPSEVTRASPVSSGGVSGAGTALLGPIATGCQSFSGGMQSRVMNFTAGSAIATMVAPDKTLGLQQGMVLTNTIPPNSYRILQILNETTVSFSKPATTTTQQTVTFTVPGGTGTPLYWNVSGFTGEYLAFNLQLRWVSGCTWKATFPSTGYVVGDILTIQGGSLRQGSPPSRLRVTAVNANGQITSAVPAPTDPPSRYAVIPPNPATTSGGSGTDASFNIVAGGDLATGRFIVSVTPVNGGFVGTYDMTLSHFDGLPPPNLVAEGVVGLWGLTSTAPRLIKFGWACPDSLWDNRGPNPMISADQTAPTVDLTVSTGVFTQPGNIHVEKYPESDFTLLGIPLCLRVN